MNVLEQMKVQLEACIAQAVQASEIVVGEQVPEILLEVPKDKLHGDYSTNIAMQLTKIVKRNPREIAADIIDHFDSAAAQVVKVEMAGPGFINFFMDTSFLSKLVPQIIQAGEKYGRVDVGNGKKIMVEFVSANPTGSLHLGHARGAAVGDTLCNILDFAGYDVTREYYINDAGNQIDNLAKSLRARYYQELGHDMDMPEDGYHGDDIREFASELVREKNDELLSLSTEEQLIFFRAYGLEKELAKLQRDLERFRVTFDVWYRESSLYESGKTEEAIAALRNTGHVFEEDGAVWLRSTTFGDDKNRVLVKNDGTYTYLTPDIAYHLDKFARGFKELINIWGADHHGYVPRVKAAMNALGYDSDQLRVLITQMVNLFQDGEKVRMSKRTGKAVTMEELMDEVGIDATRYFFTMRSLDSHLDFDLDLAVSQSNDNPVYYVQYAYARICSIFRQAEEQSIPIANVDEVDLTCLSTEASEAILQKMGELPAVITEAAHQYAPHRLVRYVFELATEFHSFYRAERIITENEQHTKAKLTLLVALRIIFENTFKLIGISAPERM